MNMRATTHDTSSSLRRVPKAFALLRSAIALADQCAQEIVANVESPDLAATGDWIEHIEEERRVLAAETEDHLRSTLLSAFDPADLHGLSAHIALLTHRSTRALYFFGLLGRAPAAPDLEALVRTFATSTRELVDLVNDLGSSSVREITERVHVLRRLRDAARLHSGRILALAPTMDNVVLWQTVGQAVDAGMAQALTVGEESLRVATKHD